jgi:hypothetical protein
VLLAAVAGCRSSNNLLADAQPWPSGVRSCRVVVAGDAAAVVALLVRRRRSEITALVTAAFIDLQ